MHLFLYDGPCGLCQRAVRFVLRRDRRAIFRFARLQSLFANRALDRHGIDAGRLDSFRLILDYDTDHERVLDRGRGAFAVLGELRFPWNLLGRMGAWIPRGLSDAGYDFVARRRARWFGRDESCPLPSPAHRDRFMDL